MMWLLPVFCRTGITINILRSETEVLKAVSGVIMTHGKLYRAKDGEPRATENAMEALCTGMHMSTTYPPVHKQKKYRKKVRTQTHIREQGKALYTPTGLMFMRRYG